MVIYDLNKAISNRLEPKNTDNGKVAIAKTTKAEVLSLEFNNSNKVVVAGCMKEIIFCTFDGGVLRCVKGNWTSKISP